MKYLPILLLISCSNQTSSIKDECSYLYNFDKTFCNVSVNSPVVIDSTFSNKELDYIKYGLSAWSITTSNHIQFSLYGYYDHNHLINESNDYLSVVRTTSKDLCKLNFIDPDAIGVYYENKIYLLPDRIESMNEFKATLVHELGHHLGLDHYNTNYDIMNHIAANNYCIWESGMPTKLDYNNLKKVYCND